MLVGGDRHAELQHSLVEEGKTVHQAPAARVADVHLDAVKDVPAALGMKTRSRIKGYTYFHSQFAKCEMIAVRIEDYTYCAIGEVRADYLQTLLEKLIP